MIPRGIEFLQLLWGLRMHSTSQDQALNTLLPGFTKTAQYKGLQCIELYCEREKVCAGKRLQDRRQILCSVSPLYD